MFAVPSGGSDFDPADPRDVLIHNQAETELVQVETQASLLIANEDHDEVERDLGVSVVQAQRKRSILKGNGEFPVFPICGIMRRKRTPTREGR
jgi:hypothetical protein